MTVTTLSDALDDLAEEVADAERALAADSNDAEFEALYGLLEVARGVLAAWAREKEKTDGCR